VRVTVRVTVRVMTVCVGICGNTVFGVTVTATLTEIERMSIISIMIISQFDRLKNIIGVHD
jgi:hypothetical protein